MSQSIDISNKRNHPKDLFTPEEDKKLISIIYYLKSFDWNLISQMMGNRNARQCKDRWFKYLSPNVNNTPFTLQEDILLLEKYNELGAKWVLISKFFNNRSDTRIKSRFMQLKRHNLTIDVLKYQLMHGNPVKKTRRQNITKPNEKKPFCLQQNLQYTNQPVLAQKSDKINVLELSQYDNFCDMVSLNDVPEDFQIEEFCF